MLEFTPLPYQFHKTICNLNPTNPTVISGAAFRKLVVWSPPMTYHRKLKAVILAITLLLVVGFVLALRNPRHRPQLDLTKFIPAGSQLLESTPGDDHLVQVFQGTEHFHVLEKILGESFGVQGGSFAVTSIHPPSLLQAFVPARSSGGLSDVSRSHCFSRLFITTTPGAVYWAHLSTPDTNLHPRLAIGGRLLSPPAPGSTLPAPSATNSSSFAPFLIEDARSKSMAASSGLTIRSFETANPVPHISRFYAEAPSSGHQQFIHPWPSYSFQETIMLWCSTNRFHVSVYNRAQGETNTHIKSAVVNAWR